MKASPPPALTLKGVVIPDVASSGVDLSSVVVVGGALAWGRRQVSYMSDLRPLATVRCWLVLTFLE
ncbi:MAG: hypothetical protein ACKESB_00415 [Candidatus Hodgkinia cicadicola]